MLTMQISRHAVYQGDYARVHISVNIRSSVFLIFHKYVNTQKLCPVSPVYYDSDEYCVMLYG